MICVDNFESFYRFSWFSMTVDSFQAGFQPVFTGFQALSLHTASPCMSSDACAYASASRPWMSGSLSGGGRSGCHWRSAWPTSRSVAIGSLASSASLPGPRPAHDRLRHGPAHPVSMGPRPEVGPSQPEQSAFDSPSVGLVRKNTFCVHPRQPPPYLNLRFALTSVQMEQAACQTPYPRNQS